MSATRGNAALRARLSALRDRLHEELATVSDLLAVRRRRSELDPLLADLDRQLDRIGRAAVITLVGATGAGKSTLINALAGREIAREGVDRPTTRQPVIYAPEDADLSDLLAGSRDGAGPVVVRHAASGPWAGEILIDAPDLNSVDAHHRAIVADLADRSDVLLVVLHHQSVVEAASAGFVDTFAGRRRLLFVLNRVDELTGAARDEILRQVRELAAGRWQAPEAPVVAISAREARTTPRSEGWSALCATLQDLARESALAGARRLNALGIVVRIAAVLRAAGDDARPDLDALPGEVATGFAALQERVAADAETRLRVRRADLNALLWAEAAKRWDGPGGLALRAGGLGSLGLVAGGALVRRSPLVAAGTAAAGLAAGRVQRALRDQRVADASALSPAAGEVAAWYAESLSPARVRAARLTGDPESFGLPGVEAARLDAASGIDEAWSVLVERDLPAAAETGALRFFRFPLDLPVYALVVWVVFQAGRGFVNETYVGVDFLLNAGVLLAAWLLAVRTAVRRALNGRVRRLLDAAVERSRGALVAQADAVGRAAEAQAGERAATLARLARSGETWRAELAADPDAGDA